MWSFLFSSRRLGTSVHSKYENVLLRKWIFVHIVGLLNTISECFYMEKQSVLFNSIISLQNTAVSVNEYRAFSVLPFSQIPESSPAKTMAAGLVKAWETYSTTRYI